MPNSHIGKGQSQKTQWKIFDSRRNGSWEVVQSNTSRLYIGDGIDHTTTTASIEGEVAAFKDGDTFPESNIKCVQDRFWLINSTEIIK